MLKKILLIVFVTLALRIQAFTLINSYIAIGKSVLMNPLFLIRKLPLQGPSGLIKNISWKIRENTLNKKMFDKSDCADSLIFYFLKEATSKLLTICAAKKKDYVKKKCDKMLKKLEKGNNDNLQAKHIKVWAEKIPLYVEKTLDDLEKKTPLNHLFSVVFNTTKDVSFIFANSLLNIISNKFLCDNTSIKNRPILFLEILCLKIIIDSAAQYIQNPLDSKNKFRNISAKKILKSSSIKIIETVELLASKYFLHSIFFFRKSNYHKTLFNKNLLAIKNPFWTMSAFISLASNAYLIFKNAQNKQKKIAKIILSKVKKT